MNKMKIALSLALLPIFGYADGELAMQNIPTPFIEYNNRMAVFGPFHQVYERTKPHAFYAGVEAWRVSTVSSSSFIGSSELSEAELRLGYNFFFNGRDHLTPFVGGGIIRDSRKYHYHTTDVDFLGIRFAQKHYAVLPHVGYGVLGFLYDHEFNSVVNLGVNVKGIIGGGSKTKRISWGGPVVGFDVAIPLTFRFGYKRHWDFRIEPFDIFLHSTNVTINYFGFRSTIGYRF